MSELVHATVVAIDGRGVMLTGPSGAGKSDLALRLIDRRAVLVADDYAVVTATDGRVHAAVPDTIAGRIEVRGVGIVAMPHRDSVAVDLVVRLAHEDERLPDVRRTTIAGISLPEIVIDPFASSAPIKVEIALKELTR